MIDSLHIAATGMHANQQSIDVIANNLANLNTPGFKKSRIVFEDLMYQALGASGVDLEGTLRDVAVGMGTSVSGASKIFVPGDLKPTGSELDFALRGSGFFELMMPDGSYAYTRTGAFRIDEERRLVNSDGHPLTSLIDVPLDATQVIVEPDGAVFATLADEERPLELGRLEVAQFMNPAGLEPMGDNLYRPTHESGDALYSPPGEDGAALVAQGFLEGSNVEMIEELTQMLTAQRAYEVNSRVIQASDELLAIVNGLRR